MAEEDFDFIGYKAAKKWLYGLLIVLIFFTALGFKLKSDTELGPIVLDFHSPNILLLVLSFATHLAAIRLLIEWRGMEIFDRRKSNIVYDHALALAVYLTANYLFASTALSGLFGPKIWITTTFAFAVLQTWVFVKTGVYKIAGFYLRNLSKSKYEQDDAEIKRLAMLVRYKMYFSPDFTYLNKIVVFAENGEITAGKNSNEWSWRALNGKLEILNERGQVFNRFRFDKRQIAWISSNDLDTLSLRNQYMIIAVEAEK